MRLVKHGHVKLLGLFSEKETPDIDFTDKLVVPCDSSSSFQL